ncbi:CoA pyrophosphatase [Geomicrobium sp. JCM 19039]|uniref:NUDIX hydrolase n=1 Tax=Geomicrobium sp. JCM 19039 TaxID=1460636 RepID=UPI00045F3E31|nr:CoA pyrophosphatase [Geomicrobium sp. JCM 19039]GAK11350.1 Nudix hydrolase YeaB [Geomicrobium sp. JCM 19039]
MRDSFFRKLKYRQPGVIGEQEAVKFAVALPIMYENDEPVLLFQVRSSKMRRQPGDICFPGGKIETEDLTSVEAAARELSEETGIPRSKAAHISSLDRWLTPYGIVVYPHVFLIDPTPLAPNDEVEELFTVPIADLLKQAPERIPIPLRPEPPEDFPYERIAGGRNYPFRTAKLPELFYEHEGRHIWGLTARILEHFLEVLNEKDE